MTVAAGVPYAKNPSVPLKVMIIAGETSGDHHGARLVAAMRRIDENIRFFGIGGPAMARQGVQIVVDSSNLSVVGITEVFSRLPGLLGGLRTVKRAVAEKRPDLVILIDFPDFNLHMARHVKRYAIPVLYYISPQLWAWRSGRIKTIRRYVDRMAVILPFEKEFYDRRGVPVTFVGHPLLDHIPLFPEADADSPDADGQKTRTIGLLPGSRGQEIRRNLPVMLAAASRLNRGHKGFSFVVSVAPGIDADWVEDFIRPYRNTLDIETEKAGVEKVLTCCCLAVAASGTVTLEAAIYGVPMVIVYRVSPVSFLLGRSLIRVKFIGLANIIADRPVVPELIQHDATPGNIASVVSGILEDTGKYEQTRKDLRRVREKLGEPGASRKTAGIAYAMMASGRKQEHD